MIFKFFILIIKLLFCLFFFTVLTGARYNDDGILSPIELVTILTKVGFHFKPNLQADVHELFIHLFSVIEDEAYKTSCSVSLFFNQEFNLYK